MHKATVLVVDDDVDVLVLTTFALEQAGYRALSATDIPQALEQARRCPPDVVLLDHRLPVQPGLGSVDQLRHEPSLAGAKLVLVTATRFAADEVKHLDGYLRKPWAPDDLYATLDRCVGAPPAVGNA